MNLIELKSKLILNEIPSILIFTGPELEVMNLYIKKIQEKLKYKVHKMESMVDVIRLSSGNSIFKVNKLFIVTDDNNFLKQNDSWKNLNKLIGSNKLILKYHNYDARLAFWKNFENETVIFERMNNSVLSKHLNKEFNICIEYCSLLAQSCDNDYYRCKLELDKVINIAKIKNINNDEAFRLCLEDVLCLNNDSDIFDFVKYVLTRNFSEALRIYNNLKKNNEPSLKILILLYTNFKNILIAQTINNTRNIQQNTGLNYYSYMKAKELSGYYSDSHIENILYEIMNLEQGIKTGKIDSSMVVDYLFSIL